ncbi:peptidase A24 [Methanocalculus taiwanensis]|uniref:Peptidase A24 n=1 Tax=Methanocalculus taiwanensis TaxID=106207 RepID=A0ABD4TJZ9_9EURY|nr:A24 family peptidase C-terminal domain-containing protein [Methanocalculus taiwanensis]MCQ1538079.1 peptidase A24 [Methanocalculus taiwanensis]
MIPYLAIPFLAVALTFLYGSLLDIRDRRVPFRTWYPMILVSVPFTGYLYYLLFMGDISWFLIVVLITLVFCGVMYAIAYFGLFGGADAWGLIFIALLIPLFPFEPLIGYPPVPIFAFSVLTNALILNLFIPFFLFIYNTLKGNRAPILYRFIGFPVHSDDLRSVFGFIIEDFEETTDGLQRRFIPLTEAISRMAKDDRIYTRDLREHPEEFQKELTLYSKAGSVWISYGVPFFIPITAGLIISCLIGDILFTLMTAFMGV